MREHPIPQDLTGYRFHIVGNMTLKQFVEVAAGVVVGVILYNTNLIPIVKWPLIFLAFVIGAALAWLPVEDRPLDHWVTTFFSILYKPTKFFWRKHPKIPQPFLFKPRENLEIVPDDVDLTPARQARIREYIKSVNETDKSDPWEDEQAEKIKELMGAFETIEVETINAVAHIEKPVLGIRVRNLQKATAEPLSKPAVKIDSLPSITIEEIAPPAPQIIAEEIVLDDLTTYPANDNPNSGETDSKIIFHSTINDEPPTEQPLQPQPTSAQPTAIQPTAPNEVLAQKIEVPKSYEDLNADGSSNAPDLEDQTQRPNFVTNQNQSSLVAPTEQVTTNSSLPFPTTPTQPNKIVGMVLDANQKIVANAIVEIKNLQGLVARAVKSNALGQFFIATPLESGTYIISADKNGLNFTQQQLYLNNQIVPPIQLSATQPSGDAVALSG